TNSPIKIDQLAGSIKGDVITQNGATTMTVAGGEVNGDIIFSNSANDDLNISGGTVIGDISTGGGRIISVFLMRPILAALAPLMEALAKTC
ncbi:hypothetical protein, partial [Snodgrassella sp. CFCC 13594]|uniref:hypothetical protein n=1 Tax=Snodgrassella sp. CFCC 13594 TaxID=1775559 RepID=UPI000B0A5F2B